KFEQDNTATIRDFDFKSGDLVLMRHTQVEKSLNRKMRPRYTGPLVVVSRNRGGAYVICELDGTAPPVVTLMHQTPALFSITPGPNQLVLLQESPATLISPYLCDFLTGNYDLRLVLKRLGTVFHRPVAAFRLIPYLPRHSIALPDNFADISQKRLSELINSDEDGTEDPDPELIENQSGDADDELDQPDE
ncbi:hypothetical protein VTO73DRAFT_6166, partial [Trametes versicolor]